MKKINQKGFTLIELLVVIAIIGLLSTLAVVSLNNARAKARDARRLSDIKQIQTALELYFTDMSQYPPTGEFATGSPIASSSITYMGVIPDNPTPRTDQGCPNVDYAYLSCDVDGSNCGSSVIHGSYTLRYCIGQTAGSVTGAVVTGVTGHYATPAGIVDD